MKNKILNIFYWVIFIVLIGTASFLFISSLKSGGDFNIYTVNSGSMSPLIYTGSIVLVKNQNYYTVGEVITYKNKDENRGIVTHRIAGIDLNDKGEMFFITKGDVNEDPDSGLVSAGSIIGKVVLDIPLVGYLVLFARTFWGWVFLLIVPAVLFVFNELNVIRKEVRGLT